MVRCCTLKCSLAGLKLVGLGSGLGINLLSTGLCWGEGRGKSSKFRIAAQGFLPGWRVQGAAENMLWKLPES